MAIKVRKHGIAKPLIAVCPDCGCEFEYEVSDIEKNYLGRSVVKCPDCGHLCPHHCPIVQPSIPNIIWETSKDSWPDCETCPSRPNPNKPVQVGDTPCDWCQKNKPYCTDTAMQDGLGVSYYHEMISSFNHPELDTHVSSPNWSSDLVSFWNKASKK